MAHRRMILTETGAQVYRNRMLTAGSPVTLGAGDARLFERHGWATAKPARGKPFTQSGGQVAADLTEAGLASAPAVEREPAKPAAKRKRARKKA